MKQLASWPDMGSVPWNSSGLAALLATDAASRMFNRTNVTVCLSHLFLFLDFLWKFSYESDLRARMNKRLPFEQQSPIPVARARSDESKKLFSDCTNKIWVSQGLIRTGKSGAILQLVQMSDLIEGKFLGFSFN